MRRRALAVLAAALLAAAALGAMLLRPRAADSGVPTFVVQAAKLERTVLAEGVLRAVDATQVRVPGNDVSLKIGWMIEDGSPVKAGEVVLRLDPSQRRDVVIVPKGGHFDSGTCANALVPARATDAGEGAAYLDCRVRIVRP